MVDARRVGVDGADWSLERDGFRHLPRAAVPSLPTLDRLAAALPPGTAGVRLVGNSLVRSLTERGALLQAVAAEAIGVHARAVRAIWFDKSDAANWALGWHQDRSIAVRQRYSLPGFGPWTVKAGIAHVAPPMDLLTNMLTLRVHIDPVEPDNAPLLVAPGSHRLGRIAEPEVEGVVARSGAVACLAERGDVWLYSTPILHASDRASAGKRRRVLQVDFAAADLPLPLQWLGV